MEPMATIQVSKRSMDAWNKLKNHPDESFEDMINRMLSILDEYDSNILTEKDIEEMKRSLDDIKNGRCVANDDLMKEYGL